MYTKIAYGLLAVSLAVVSQKAFAKEQDFVITAYYSPLPNQCCYVKGSLPADIELNGHGIRGADGTEVYAGMVAAPPSYPFGTRIVLPGIGTFTVHDRGGAIQEQGNIHRLDLWVGHGEEGLARALAFGVERVKGSVYFPGEAAPPESFTLASLPAPPEKIRPYLADDTTLFSIKANAGDRSASVQFLQERLKAIGYFDDVASGFFGPVTEQSLRNFYRDMGVSEPSDRLTENGAAVIEAAFARREAKPPLAQIVDAASSEARIAEAQRTLRFLGFYKGRTNGRYDDTLKDAVLAFQKQQSIIASEKEAGAGRIGPKTRQTIVLLWQRAHARKRADQLLAIRRLDQLLAKRGLLLSTFIAKGDRGDHVRALQKFLVSKNYLESDGITGTFGDRTQQALINYQRDSGIIAAADAQGAGYAGPATLARYRRDIRAHFMNIVRAKGWAAI